MNGVTPSRQPQLLLSYLLLGVLLTALAVSFYRAWDWSSESWFRIGLAGGTNAGYSPGPLIPVLVLFMIGTRLRRLPPTPEIAKQDWFNAAFEAILWPAMTGVIRVWHRIRNISMSPEAQKAKAYEYRTYGVWVVWGILAAALALSLHLASYSKYARWHFMAKPVAPALLFLHVVIFSAAIFYVAWRIFHADEKARALSVRWTSQAAGIALLLFFLLFHFAAIRGDMLRLSIVSFLGCLVGLIWLFYGWRVARIFLFPLAFMIFTLPMEWIEDRLGLPAQIFATKSSVNIMDFLGVKVAMIGKTSFEILRESKSVDFSVAAPCSGLKSLVALTAISATYAYMTQKTMPKMVAIMLCGPFIAVLTNIVRLVAVGVTAQFWGRGPAMAVHDRALPIYILGILLLMAIDKLVNSKWLRIEDF